MLVVAVVAILVVGPKDLPGMLRSIGKTVGNLRRMAGDFQRQFSDALKESELDELKNDMAGIGSIENPLDDINKSANELMDSIGLDGDDIDEAIAADVQAKPTSEDEQVANILDSPAVKASKAAAKNSTAKKSVAKKAVSKKPATTKATSAAGKPVKKPAAKKAAPGKAANGKAPAAKAAPRKSTVSKPAAKRNTSTKSKTA